MLFRAVAYMPQSDEPECHVFFEARTPGHAGAVLSALLQSAWQREAEFYNLFSAVDLCGGWACAADAGRSSADADPRLLQTGHDGTGPLYCHPDRTLFFVRPATLARLRQAQWRADVAALGIDERDLFGRAA